jgi:hypothetical protein
LSSYWKVACGKKDREEDDDEEEPTKERENVQ